MASVLHTDSLSKHRQMVSIQRLAFKRAWTDIFSDCFVAVWDNKEAIRVMVRYREWENEVASGAYVRCACVYGSANVCVCLCV